jgi:glycosyltransferase involved in cell wall biosynthesis
LALPQKKFLLGYAAQDTFFDLEPVLGGLKIITDRGVDAELVLSGNAPMKLKKKVDRHGLAERVRFLGYLDWDDYPYFQSACDVLVVPFPKTVYNIGRWPGKFGEYVAAGRPVVFNPVGDLEDFAGPEAPGIACDFSAGAFAEAFETLYSDPRLRTELGSRARKLACEEMDWEKSIDRFEAIYEGLLEERASSGRQDRMGRDR